MPDISDVIAQAIAESDEKAGLDAAAYDVIAPIYHLAAEAVLAILSKPEHAEALNELINRGEQNP